MKWMLTVLLLLCANLRAQEYSVPDPSRFCMTNSWLWGGSRVRLDLSLDSGQTWPVNLAYGIDTGGEAVQSYISNLNITPAMWSETCRVGMRTLWYDAVEELEQESQWSDLSDSDFTIAGLRILSPTNGQSVSSPSIVSLSWHEAGAAFVRLGFSSDGVTFEDAGILASPGVATNSTLVTLSAAPAGPLWFAVQGLDSNQVDIPLNAIVEVIVQ
jgi:hypothetical protein